MDFIFSMAYQDFISFYYMISNTFLYIVYIILYGLLSPFRLLSDVSLPVGLTNAITTANGFLTALNGIIPVSTLLVIVSLVLTIEGFIFSFKLVSWIIRKIPMIS